MVTVGFFGLQISDLNNKYFTELAQKQTNDTELATKKLITELQSTITQQQNTIDSLSGKLATLSTQINTGSYKKYMPAPEYTVSQSLFSTTNQTSRAINILGAKNEITAWEERNDFYLEPLMKKILPFKYDRSRGAISVTDIIPDSIFYQMGLRKGDRIIRVNGRHYSQGMPLRYKLLDKKNKQIVLVRDGRYKTIHVSYTDTPTPKIDNSLSETPSKSAI